MRRNQPNIIDIARRAGVGKSTVARVLSDSGPVSEGARHKVLAAAEKLHYRANAAARALRKGENRLLGIVVPDRASRGVLSFTLSSQKLEGIARGAKKLGYDLQIFIEDMQDEESFRRLATEKFVRGVFLLGGVPQTTIAMLERYGIEWMGVNWHEKKWARSPACTTDFRHAGKTMISHLIELGCRRVLAFDWLSFQYGPFGEGIRSTWKKHGRALSHLQLETNETYLRGPEHTDILNTALNRKRPPDGILTSSEPGMVAAYSALQAKGLRPGRDAALVTFDDLGTASHMDPPCSAYAQPGYEMGEACVEEMDRMLRKRKSDSVRRLIPGELRVRGSSNLFSSP